MCYDVHEASSWHTNLYIYSSYKSPPLHWYAALQRRKRFWFLRLLLSTYSGVSLSFLSLYCSLLHRRHSSVSIQHEQWTPPSINQLTLAKTVIYSDNSPWHKPLHIQNMASSNLCRLLICDMNHYTHLYGKVVIYAVNLSITWTIIHTEYGKAVIYVRC